MKSRRKTRSKLWLVVPIVVVVAGLLIGMGYYGRALGISGLSHAVSSEPSSVVTIASLNMTSYPAIDDGYAGLGLQASLVNHNTVKIENTTIWVDNLSLGSCTTPTIQPGQQGVCKVGQEVLCQNWPSAPYSVKVEVAFLGGTTQTTTTETITTQVSATLDTMGC